MGEWKKTGCNLCGLSCNLEMYVEDNHILDVRPNQKGLRNSVPYCCRKGRSMKTLQEDPRRLNYPLKKVGDHFERISWEQATTEIAEKANAILEKYGPRSAAFIGFNQAHAQSEVAAVNFFKSAIGAQYYYAPLGIEFMGAFWSYGRIIGNQSLILDAEGDVDSVDAIIYWGSNSYVSHNLMTSSGRFFIRDMSERKDKKVIVIDPRVSETARMADIHVMPRPGTDALLARGLIAMIVDRGLENREYLDKWCADWDQARKWYEDFDYREAFKVCEVPFEQMEELVQVLTSCTWGVHQDLGVFFNRNNTLTSFFIVSLSAVTGNLMTKGNRPLESIVSGGPSVDERTEGVWRTLETDKFPVGGTYPVSVLPKEMLADREDRHRMIFLSQSNPIISYPDAPQMRKGFENLDLFVCFEMVPTETTQYADYLLPTMSGFESYQWSALASERVYMKHPFIEPIAERKHAGMALLEIADKMGLIPEMPESIYQSAAKSVEDRDIVPFFGEFMGWFQQHPEHMAKMTLCMLYVMSQPEALGNVDRASLRLALITSDLQKTKFCDRAGFHAIEPYASIPGEQGAMLAGMSKMDQVFWALDESDDGVRIGVTNPDPDEYAYEHILTPDHKVHLFDETIDSNLWYLTPEREAAALKEEMGEYPMLLSSGNHEDGGVNGTMRNPASYNFRKPYTLLVNPEDAENLGLNDGDVVAITTKVNTVQAPVEITYRCPKSYCLLPHHYGMEHDGKIFYGAKANDLTSGDDIDPITGNPYLRWVPCKLTKVDESEVDRVVREVVL